MNKARNTEWKALVAVQRLGIRVANKIIHMNGPEVPVPVLNAVNILATYFGYGLTFKPKEEKEVSK